MSGSIGTVYPKQWHVSRLWLSGIAAADTMSGLPPHDKSALHTGARNQCLRLHPV